MSRSQTPDDPDVLDANLGKLMPMADAPAMRPEARARIRSRLLAVHARPRRERSPVALAGWTLALGAAAAFALVQLRGSGDGGEASREASGKVASPGLVTPPDQVKLPDGSTADLGPGGKVTVLGDRKVRVAGAVLLDIVPGQGAFTVETSHGELEVLGTRFLVEASADQTMAAVLRGAVAMRSAGREAVVRAGEQGTMTARTAPVRAPAPRLSHLVSWVAERRRRDEVPAAGPARSGVLVARNPLWQEQEFPLPLRALTVDVHLENQVARVALDQTFHNPEAQQLEGVYKFSLPPDAAVARLAMYVDGRLTESAVVERMRARRIYEDIVYTHRDPALLEQMGASKVSMRIFPLFPEQDRRVLLAYTQPLARTYDDVTLTVPLPDLELAVPEGTMQVKVVGCGACEISSPSHRVEVERTGADAVVRHQAVNQKLGDSLVLRVRQPAAPAVSVASTLHDARRYGLVRVRPTVDAAQALDADRPRRWVILSDTSASRGRIERRAQTELVDRLIQEIDEHDQVAVVAFDATHRRFAAWQDAIAVDRQALAAFLMKDGGLGETDLVSSLEGAVRLLEGQPGYVVYLGDGTATGGRRTIDQLRDAGAGKATFIGVGVGDGTDMPTLSALADATAGMALHVDLGDDLAWRALDLVAALYTPRVTGLVATLEAGGQVAEDEVSAYLRSAQVAAGEDIEVVVRAPARADLKTLVLRGRVGDQPWTQRVDLTSAPRAPGDAGYLPRLWAERRIDHLMTVGDRALAPCTTTPCASEHERAVAAYHTRKGEIVELGKAHFLLSPHTSLIVLENDAMYRQYGVEKGSGLTWAPYAAPATIPVATRVAAPVTDPRPMWRTPVPWLHGGWGDLDNRLGRRTGGFTAASGFGKNADVAGGLLGGGRFGTVGQGAGGGGVGGTGTGSGYGVGAGSGAPAATATAAPREELQAEAKMSSGRDRGGDADDATLADPAPASEPDMAFELESEDLVTVPPARRPVGAADEADLGAVLREQSQTRGPMRARRWAGEGELGLGVGRGGLHRHYYYPGLAPIAFHHSGDWRLDDVTEWLPGFARTGYDDLAAALDAAAAGGRGSVSADARRLLDDARRRLGAGRWRLDDGGEVVLDAAGRLELTRTLEVGTREVIRYDGITLVHRYPSLGLETTRAASDREPAVLAAYLPVVAPRADTLARWYHVTVSGPRTVRLTPVARGGAPWELELDDAGAVVAMHQVRGAQRTALVTAARDGDGYVVTVGGRRQHLRHTPDLQAALPAAPTDLLSIGMPLGTPAAVRATLDALAPGDPARRRVLHQYAASVLATGEVGALAGVATSLADVTPGAPLSPAELALVGGALGWVAADKATAMLGTSDEPLAAYLRASLAQRRGRPADFAAVAARASGVVAVLADYRAALVTIERRDARAALAAFDAFASRHLRADTLRLIGAARLVQHHAYRAPDAVTALDRVADGAWRNLARQEAARMLYRKPAEAAERWVALLSDVDLAAAPPMIDGSARNVVVASARGEVGWQLAMAAWKQRVLGAGSYDHVMAFAAAAALTPASGDLDQALDRAAAVAGDADELAAVVTLASQYGRHERARATLDLARGRFPGDPRMLRLASAVAEQSGDVRLAAELFAQVMAAEADRPAPLSSLRADFTRLIGLHAQRARATAGADRQAARDAALAAGRDWRAIDPDFAGRERVLGELLLTLGEAEEGWRYLSTPIDLAPREGASFQVAAEALERHGQLEQALGLWWRAFAIDATNPTWLQRAAQLELALGQKDKARETLTRIARGEWHQRWGGVRYWAQEALRQR